MAIQQLETCTALSNLASHRKETANYRINYVISEKLLTYKNILHKW